jgi:hypothetical protein
MVFLHHIFKTVFKTCAEADGDDVAPFVDITNTHANRQVTVRFLNFIKFKALQTPFLLATFETLFPLRCERGGILEHDTHF